MIHSFSINRWLECIQVGKGWVALVEKAGQHVFTRTEYIILSAAPCFVLSMFRLHTSIVFLNCTKRAMAEGYATFHVDGLPEPCQTWYKVIGDLTTSTVPLIVLHGGPGACHEYLLPLADLTTSRAVPVVFYDQIGNGRSTHLPDKAGNEKFWSVDLFRSEVDNLISHLGLENRTIDMYGHSWGGMLAAVWASAVPSPSNLRRLVISNSLASMDAWRDGITILRKQLPSDVKEVLDRAEENKDFESPEYEAAVEVFYKRHLSLARPWPSKEVQSALDWFSKDATTYGTM